MGATGTEFDAEYGADQIQILEGLEAVQKDPVCTSAATTREGTSSSGIRDSRQLC